MVKPINMYKDPVQQSILRWKAMPCALHSDELDKLVQDLQDTALAHPNCVGLSSNQIWDNPVTPPPAVFVVKGETGVWVVINPVVDKQWKKEIKDNEGCMSFPGIVKKVIRPRHISVTYVDPAGTTHTGVDLFDMPARVFMHEYDHLQGILIEDK